MNKALVTLIMDTGLVKLDWLKNCSYYKSRPAHKRIVRLHVCVYSSKCDKNKEYN